MNKMNKKGFTLIEMLVVIAIIAVLVSIIVPVVGNSTVKAAAATNAANLRSYASEVAIIYLSPADGTTVTADDNGKISIEPTSSAPTAPTSKKCGNVYAGNETAEAYLVNGEIVAKFGDKGVDYFAGIAETGKDTTSESSSSSSSSSESNN